MPALKIAIIGSRGIPNSYGGFEQLAQFLAKGLVGLGHDVTVYSPHHHPWQKKEWNGVKITHCYDAEHILGTAGQFIYDLNCIRDARKKSFDILLFLGYTSSSVWGRWYPKNAVVISNMDGLEWKRSKYARPVQRFLQYAEKLAIKYSHHLIADSPVIQQYLRHKYNAESYYIPYGAALPAIEKTELLNTFNLSSGNYFMLMARMEPENNIEMILDGFHQSNSDKTFIAVGDTGNKFGLAMVKKFGGDKRIRFAGALYDERTTYTLRKNCSLYFHGHSVGGTNPSLLEAMANKAMIAAHDNAFNRAVLQQDALYFDSATAVKNIIEAEPDETRASVCISNNILKIQQQYNWPAIVEQYHNLITRSYNLAKQ